MNSQRLLPLRIGIGLALCLGGCAFSPRFTATNSRAFSAPPVAARVDALIDTGSITLGCAADGTTTAIDAQFTCGGLTQEEADQRLTQADLEVVTVEGDTVRIRALFPKPHRNGDKVSLTITLPTLTGALLRTDTGTISISDAGGPVDVMTDTGSVTVERCAGSLVARTDTGGITVTSHGGAIDAETDTGRITIEGCEGALRAHADTGRITVTGHTGAVEAQIDTGSVRIELTDRSDAPVSIKTDTGGASLSVGKAFNGVIEAQVDTGRVRVEGDEARISAQDMGRHHGSVTVGDGGERSTIVTDTGSIELRVR
jgi:hypothetical protein